MRQLLLLRHAEAEPARADLPDFDRRLTPRGRAQARQAAQRLAAAGLRPEALLASPAARTRETGEIVAAGIGSTGRMVQPAALYLADAPQLLSILRGCDAAVQTLLLVGHNPGLSALARELVHALAGTPAGDGTGPLDTITLDLCGLCCLSVEAPSWHELAPQAVRALSMP